MSVLLGHAADAGLMLRAAIRESQWRSGMTWRVPLGWVLTDGLSDVAMRRWRAVMGQWRGLARSGLVRIGFVGGHFGMLRFAVGGLASSGGCHTLVTLILLMRPG